MKELAISELILGREVIIDVDETEADARFKQIIANIQREDIDPVDLGHAFVMLKERYGYQYNEIAEIIGKTPHYVTSKVGLVKRLAPEVQEMVVSDREASKCIRDTASAKGDNYEMNVKVIEDIARLPEERQKDAYVAIRSKEMPSEDALKYLRSVKKGLGDKKIMAPTHEALSDDKAGESLVRQIEKLDRDVEVLAGCIDTTVWLNRPEVIQRIEATLEKLSSLYARLKVETPDGSPMEQPGDAGLAIYGDRECIHARFT